MVRQQFLIGTSFFKLLKILSGQNSRREHILDILRLMKVGVISTVFGWIDYLRYQKNISKTTILSPPVFIIGHWRSGTTYLQKILSQDQQFTTPTFYQCVLPQAYISAEKIIKPTIQNGLPSKRIFDAMPFGADEPFDDEFALLKLTAKSRMLHFVFPEKSCFDEQEKLHNVDAVKWSKQFLWFAKKLTYSSERRLLFKSPMNTFRINELLNLFPSAKFIYIYRNPKDVFSSSIHQANKLFEHNQLIDNKTSIKEYVISRYNALFDGYEKNKKYIPESQLIEVSFEALEASPMKTIKSIYNALGIKCLEKSSSNIEEYIDSIQGYKKNTYTITKDDLSLVIDKWSKAYDIYRYEKH